MESRYGSGLFLGSRTVCLDEVGVQIKGEKSSGSKECLGDKRGQSSSFNEVQQFQQFKVVQLCMEEVKKRIEEYFGVREVPRRIEEAVEVCEREIGERISSLRMLIGASGLVSDMENVGSSLQREYDVRKWKKAVTEGMEERVKKGEVEVGHYEREKGRMEDLFGSRGVRREDSKERRPEWRESQVCHGCGERGHLRKDCGRFKKD